MSHVLAPDPGALDAAVASLRRGQVLGLPTETVYGLAADALDPRAVERIFALKRRPADNPLIVHLGSSEGLEAVTAAVTPLARDLAARFWPGPLTLVLEAHDAVPAVTTGGLGTVAVRVPDHPVAQAVLSAFAGPLAAPSANRSGRPSPTTAAHVVHEFGDEVELVLDGGPCPIGVESTVVDVRGDTPLLLREGSISREQLHAVDVEGEVAGSPGTRYRHYAPSCAVRLVAPGTGPRRAAAIARAGVRVGLVATAAAPQGVVDIASFHDAPSLAQRLFAALRDAELAGVEVLVVEEVPEVGVGRAVMDRLRRAAA